MKRIALLLLLTLSLPLTLRADDSSRRDKAKELLILLHTDRLLQQIMDGMKQQVGTMAKPTAGSSMTPAQQARISDFQQQLFTLIESQMSYKSMEPDYIKLYADNFTGKERDTESGLDYFGARYYASSMGRFMSPDWAAKATPVPYAKLDNPQSLNLYAYVGNNPLSHIDPDGHIDCSGKNAAGAGCQAIAQWNKDHGIDPNAKKSNFPGVPVKLPNGKTVPDPHSPTGVMMAPTSSVSDVAAAGKKAGQDAQRLDPMSVGGVVFTVELGKAVGTGGQFDDQRMGPQSDVLTGGFQQLPQFRDVSNFNVGLFSQQAGMTLDQTLQTAGDFAQHFSSNYSPNSPYGLAPQTAEFIRTGWQAGATQF
jgi:RHS repeat-associated protein